MKIHCKTIPFALLTLVVAAPAFAALECDYSATMPLEMELGSTEPYIVDVFRDSTTGRSSVQAATSDSTVVAVVRSVQHFANGSDQISFMFTPKGVGTATVTLTGRSGSELDETISFAVSVSGYVLSLAYANAFPCNMVAGETLDFVASVVGNTTQTRTILASSSDSSVVSLSSSAKSMPAGTDNVTFTLVANVEGTATVTVCIAGDASSAKSFPVNVSADPNAFKTTVYPENLRFAEGGFTNFTIRLGSKVTANKTLNLVVSPAAYADNLSIPASVVFPAGSNFRTVPVRGLDGNFDFFVTISDPDGEFEDGVLQGAVQNAAPIILYSTDPENPVIFSALEGAPTELRIDAADVSADQPTLKYHWSISSSTAAIVTNRFYSTGQLVTVYATDKDGGRSETAYFEIRLPDLRITTLQLPETMELFQYEYQLEAVGGTMPYSWSAASPDYSFERVSNTFAETGEDQGWPYRWRTKSVALPFEFPFYGNQYDSVFVGENGTLSFGKEFTSTPTFPGYDSDAIAGCAIIAPLWDDYDDYGSRPCKMFIDESSDRVTFRWCGYNYDAGTNCNFAATLHRDGTIRFSYGSGKSRDAAAAVSAGDGLRYTLIGFKGNGIGDNADDVLLNPCLSASDAAMPPGFSISSDGILSGMASSVSTNRVYVLATDSDGVTVSKEFPFVVAANPNKRPVIDASTEPGLVSIRTDSRAASFFVDARDPEGADLSYVWVLDGTNVQGATESSFEYVAKARDGSVHSLEVFVNDDLWTNEMSCAWTVRECRNWFVTPGPSAYGTPRADGLTPETPMALSYWAWDGWDESEYDESECYLRYLPVFRIGARDGDVIWLKPGDYHRELFGDSVDYNHSNAVRVVSTDGPDATRLHSVEFRNLDPVGSLDWSLDECDFPLSAEGVTFCGGWVGGVALSNCVLTAGGDDTWGGIERCRFSDCVVKGNPWFGATQCEFRDCIVTGNENDDKQMFARCRFVRCTVAGNTAASAVVGLGCHVSDSILWGNETRDAVPANYLEGEGPVWDEERMDYKIDEETGEWETGPQVYFEHSCTWPMPIPAAGSGNTDSDPRLVDAANGDLRIRVDSPCIENGKQAMGTVLDAPVDGFVVSVRIAGNGSVEPMTAIVEPGGSSAFAASGIAGRPFLTWNLDEGAAGLPEPENPIATLSNIGGDVVLTARFGSFDFHVDAASGADDGDGLSWETAKSTIQAALDDALDGETVLVKPGIYEPIDAAGKTVRIESTSGAAATVIDGGGTTRCAYLGRGPGEGTTVAGFTLRNGYASEGGAVYGGCLERCSVLNNQATVSWWNSGGGACYSMLWNCLLAGNTASYFGGGAYNSTLYNCTVVGNTASAGGGMYFGSAYNSVFHENETDDCRGFSSYNCLIGENPLFADASQGDYQLTEASPCVNAGNSRHVRGETDFAGNPRIVGGAVDIGCYEYPRLFIASLSADAGAGAVSNAIERTGFRDKDAVMVSIGGDANRYGSFKDWAGTVKADWSVSAADAGEAAVVDSPFAAVSWLLGSQALFAREPEIEFGNVELVNGQQTAVDDAVSMRVTVAVKDGDEVARVSADNVAALFEATSDLTDWDGDSSLAPTVSGAVSNGDGTMTFTVTPGDGTADRAFLRVKVR